MYINGQKLTLKRFSSGELKILKSELEKHIKQHRNLLRDYVLCKKQSPLLRIAKARCFGTGGNLDFFVNKFPKVDISYYIKNNCAQILYTGEESFLELIIILRYLNSISTKIDLVLSYLPYQRMDHVGRDELDTVNYVANILNDLKLNSITICEPHCEINMFKNAKEFSYVENIKQKVFDEIGFNENNDTIVLTDKGGLKRYGDLTNNVVYFNKVRDLQTGLIVKHEIVGKIKANSKCIIVDDIISTGDTILNVVEYLKSIGISQIYIMCGHYEKNKYNNRLIGCDDIKKIYSSNSLKKSGQQKIKIV